MKIFLGAIVLLTISVSVKAQFGPAYKFDYSSDGSRIERRHVMWVSYTKPGRDNDQQADTIIGIQKQQNALESKKEFVRSYPNPVKDKLFVENMNWKENETATIKVFDAGGKHILSKNTNLRKEQIGFNGVAPGTYQVQYFLNGKYQLTWKIIKL